MWGRDSSQGLSQNIHLLGRLSRKVRSIHSIHYNTNYIIRVLIATIRNNGAYPCIRCLIPKKDFYKLAQLREMRYRLSKAHVDDSERKRLVRKSIKTMEKKRLPVTSESVTGALDFGSMTPVAVSKMELYHNDRNPYSFVERLLQSFEPVWLQCI